MVSAFILTTEVDAVSHLQIDTYCLYMPNAATDRYILLVHTKCMVDPYCLYLPNATTDR